MKIIESTIPERYTVSSPLRKTDFYHIRRQFSPEIEKQTDRVASFLLGTAPNVFKVKETLDIEAKQKQIRSPSRTQGRDDRADISAKVRKIEEITDPEILIEQVRQLSKSKLSKVGGESFCQAKEHYVKL